MQKTNIINILFLVLFAITLSGCSTVPDNVKRSTETENKLDNHIIHNGESTDFMMSSSKYADSIKGKKVNQFIFPNYIDVPMVNELNVYSAYVPVNYMEIGQDMLHFMGGPMLQSGLTVDKMMESDVPTEWVGHEFWYVNKDDEEYDFSSSDKGGFICDNIKRDSYEYDYNSCRRIESYYLDKNIPDVSYNLKDGMCSLERAVELLNDFLAGLENVCGDGYHNIPIICNVVQTGENTYLYSFIIERNYNGIPLDTSLNYNYNVKREDYVWVGSPLYIEMSNQEYFDYVWNGGYTPNPKYLRTCNTFVDLETTVDIISKEMDDKYNWKFDTVGLKYVIRQDNPKDSNGNSRYNIFSRETIDETCKLQPYWIFTVDINAADYAWYHNIHSLVIMVDAETGEVYTFSGSGNGAAIF